MPWLCSSVGEISHLNKMQFLIVTRRKSQEFFPKASFFFVLYTIAYQNVLIPRKLLCSKKFLVTRLGWLLLSFALVNIKNQTTRKTDDEHGFIAQHKLNKIKCLNIQITTARIWNSFRPTSHIAGKKSYTPFDG